MSERGEAIRSREDGRRLELVELAMLVVVAIWSASFFAPALPRLHLPSARWSSALGAAVVLLLSYDAFHRRRELVRAWRSGLVLTGIVLLQFLTRIPYLTHHLASLNSDRAVTLLMVEHIREGMSRPIYFYGQLYQGSLDAYLYALVPEWLASPAVSVLVGNLVLLSVFVFLGVLLMRHLSASASSFYPLVVPSLPVGAMLFVSMDRVHGFALVACLLAVLMYRVFRSVFDNREGFLWLGFAAGLLFWSYQPSLTWIVALFVWLASSLVRARRWEAVGKACWQTPVGATVGALPHILSEVNNGFVNTRSFLLAAERSSSLPGMAEVKAALSAVLRLDSPAPGSETAWYGVVLLCFGGVLLCLWRAVEQKDSKWIFLPGIFGLSLGLLLLSGFPPVARYLVHYRLYGLFAVLLAALACRETAFLNRAWIKACVGAVLLLVTLGESVAAHRRLAGSHEEERAAIERLGAVREDIILGDYWNTLRFAPFTSGIMTAAPSARHPYAILRAAKYYPLALRLGEAWEREARGLISRHSERGRIERLLLGLDVKFTSETLDGFVLYSEFTGGLSAELAALLVEGAAAERSIRAGDYLALEKRLARLPLPEIDNRTIVVPALDEGDPLDSGLRSGWHYVVERADGADGEAARMTIPLDPLRSGRFTLPAPLSLERGAYQAKLYYLGRPVHDYGRIGVLDLPAGLVLSTIRDEMTFVTHERGEPRSGLPLRGLTLSVREETIQALELHVYSLFDFGSSIWTNRYQQALLVDDREIPLRYGENRVALPVMEGKSLHLDTRYKTLLAARDSRGSPVFHNTGAVLERVTVHARDRSYDFVPAIVQSPED